MELAEDLQIAEERVPCQFCNRKFIPQSLSKHAVVCEKTLNKKRRTFDSAKQRIQGTELAEFTPPTKNEPLIIVSTKEKSKAQEKLKRIDVPSRKFPTKTASPSVKMSNYEKCEYCDRTFGPKAFDRHVEWCKERSCRINSTCSAVQEAKERLEARIKYRAPSFRAKRGTSRSNYSLNSVSSDSPTMSVKSEYLPPREEKIKKPQEAEKKYKIQEKMKPAKETNFIRQNVLRFSYKPKPQSIQRKSYKQRSDLPNQKPEVSHLEDWILTNGSKIDHPRSSSRSVMSSSLTTSFYDDCDPFELAEQQLLKLLDDDSEEMDHQSVSPNSKEDKLNKFQNKENILSANGPVKTISCQTDNSLKEDRNFKTSPTSAFEKYHVNGNDKQVELSPLNSDFNNEKTFRPLNKTKKMTQSQDNHNINRYPLISLSNLSLCSSISLDIADEDRKHSVGKVETSLEDCEQPLKQNVSVVDKGNKNNVKKNLKMENLLYGNEERGISVNDSYGDDIDLTGSFDEFESMIQNSFYEDDHCTIESESPTRKQNLKRERGDSLASKASIDSAYNSLSRKSPSILSPETNLMKTSTTSVSSDYTQNEQKLSKFCHECGARFPLSIAKFCCECGVRRLGLSGCGVGIPIGKL